MTIPISEINEALRLLPLSMDTRQARVMLIAIGLQESRFTARRQLVGNPPKPVGPAAGFWQFEKGGGVKGVLNHHSSCGFAIDVCKARGVAPEQQAVWTSLQTDDVLAAAFARLLLYTDPKRLPDVGDVEGGWSLYLRTWRPGAHERGSALDRAALRNKWAGNYAKAVETTT